MDGFSHEKIGEFVSLFKNLRLSQSILLVLPKLLRVY